MLINKTADSARVLGNDLKASKEEEVVPTKIFLNFNVPYGYHKRETETSLKLINERFLDNYGPNNEVQRRFTFEYNFDSKFRHAVFFNTAIKALASSAFEKGLQHSLILYEPVTLNYYTDFLGLKQQKSLERCQLFHTLKFIIELANYKSDVQTPVQVSMVALSDDDIIDLFNQGKPLESPLGYTLDAIEHIESFLEYSRTLLGQSPELEHLCVSIYYQNKKLLPGDELETRDACLNFILLRGDEAINLASFLNSDKDRMNESSMNNYVEKLLLHFLSSNYDPESLPYNDLPLTYFLKKYLPYSTRKDIAFYLDMKNKPIETIANDLLYAELCQEVAEVPKYDTKEMTEDHEPSVYESRILQNLSLTHDKIKREFQDLQFKKNQLEESVVKLDSASTAGTNPLNQIQKFSLNSQYERFLHEMNLKLKTLVQASADLLGEVNLIGGGSINRDKVPPSVSSMKTPPRGNEGVLSSYTRENTVIVKDVKHKYPSIMIPGSDHSEDKANAHTDSNRVGLHQRLDKTLLGQIEMVSNICELSYSMKLQKELKVNLDCFSENFDRVKQYVKLLYKVFKYKRQLKDLQSTQDRKKLEELMPRFAEMKAFAEQHDFRSLNFAQDSHIKSAVTYRDSGTSQQPSNKKNISSGLDSARNKKETDRSSMYQVEAFKDEPLMSPKREILGLKPLAGVRELVSSDKQDLNSGGTTTRREYSSPIKKVQTDPRKQEMLGVTWKKLLAFSFKEVNAVMDETFYTLTKDNASAGLCNNQKSKQKVKPTVKQQGPQGKIQMVTTLEEFRTTYERFETDAKMLEESKSFDEEDWKHNVDPLRIPPSDYFANFSIESIKPINNKQSFSLTQNSEGHPFYLKLSKTQSGIVYSSKKGEGLDYRSDKANTGKIDLLTQSILHKLEALDTQDAMTKVLRRKF